MLSGGILAIVVPVALAMLALAMAFNMWRMALGPALADRILALDTLTINAIALLMLFDVMRDTRLFVEVALLLAAMGFVGTVALAKFVLSGNLIE